MLWPPKCLWNKSIWTNWWEICAESHLTYFTVSFVLPAFCFIVVDFFLRIFILTNALFPEWCFIFFQACFIFAKHILYLKKHFSDICKVVSWCEVHKHLLALHEHTQGCVGFVTIRALRHDHKLFVLILFFSSGIRVLVDAREKLHIPWGKPSNQQHGNAMMAFDTRSTMLQGHGMVEYKVFQFYLPSIRALWADEGIQTAYDRRREFQLVSQIMSQRWHSLCIQKSSDSNT